MTISEKKLAEWAQPLGIREENRCRDTVAKIYKAIVSDPILSQKEIEVFEQGSHRNNTNVRLDSDVDVCVMLKEVFYFDLPEGKTREQFDLNSPSDYTFEEYKKRVVSALRRIFSRNFVKVGNKSIEIRSNVTGVNADVVPAFEHKRYSGRRIGRYYEYDEGMQFFTKNGDEIVNFPKQHNKNGNRKNGQTNGFYKPTVRLLKKINYKLDEDGFVPSFLVECLAWNVPNKEFSQNYTYTDRLKGVLYHIYSHTKKNSNRCDDWGEVSELLYLFRKGKGWTKKDAEDFATKAWNYVGLG